MVIGIGHDRILISLFLISSYILLLFSYANEVSKKNNRYITRYILWPGKNSNIVLIKNYFNNWTPHFYIMRKGKAV